MLARARFASWVAVASDRSATQTRLLWLTVLVIFVALRLPYLHVPFERDEGGYGYIAQRALLGEVPYRDAFDQKPPLIFVPYALAFVTLGESVVAVHLVLWVWSACTLLVVAAIGRRLGGPLAAAAAALVFAVLSASPRLLGFTANTEMFMLLPMTAALWCALRAPSGERGGGWWFLCGALAGTACWFKHVALTSALALAAYAAVTALRAPGARRWRCALARLAWLGAGVLCASAPIVAFFALREGALQPFIDGVARYNLAYVQSVPLRTGLTNLVHALETQAPAFLPIWVLALAALLLPGVRATASLLALWLAALAAGTSAGFYFREHYFMQIVPALALLAGLAAATLLERLKPRPVLGATALVLLVAAPTVWADRELLLAESPAAISREIYGPDPFPESEHLARIIAAGSRPDETVFILGSEPQILLLARRKSATRFIFAHTLMLGLKGSEQRHASAVDEVRAARPRFVLLEWQPDSVLETAGVPGLRWTDPRWEATGDLELEWLFVWDPRSRAYRELEREAARSVVAAGAEDLRETAWLALYRRPD